MRPVTEMCIVLVARRLVLYFQCVEGDIIDKYEPRPLIYAVKLDILSLQDPNGALSNTVFA